MNKVIRWSVGTVLIIGLFVFGYLWIEDMKNITAKEQVEMYYEAYNKKDFNAFYDMLSDKEKKIFEESTYSDSNGTEVTVYKDREEILKGFEKNWRAFDVIEIDEQNGRTDDGTIVAATIYYPPYGSDSEITFIETFKLIKVNDEWKFDDYLGKEIVN